jgi:DNA-binding GntR family transcriptional regulator
MNAGTIMLTSCLLRSAPATVRGGLTMEVAGVDNNEAGMPSGQVTIERRTLMQQAYAAIRQMIITGELAVGSKVTVRPLSERLSLSPTPIKAALVGLERDGFLTAIPHRGYYVPEVNVQDMREIYELREALDGIAARNVAAQPGAAAFVRDTLAPLYAKQEATQQLRDAVGYSDADLEFHYAIWHASGNSRLLQVTGNLVGQVRFGSGSSSRLPGRILSALHEHASIMKAMAAGDSAGAERESRAHVRRSAAAFEEAVRARQG